VAGRDGEAASSGRWRVVVSGARVPDFAAVSALSSRDVWAVGSARIGGRRVPVAAHWNGRAVRVLRPFARLPGAFSDVDAVSRRDVWALGSLTAGAAQTPLVTHWNGRRWRRVPTPALGDARLTAIAALPRGQVWVVGRRRVHVSVTDPAEEGELERPFVLHRQGGRWQLHDISTVAPECPWLDDEPGGPPTWIWHCETVLTAIDAASPRDVWALGTTGAVDFAGFHVPVLHWNGTRWTQRTGPPRPPGRSGGRSAVDVAALAPGDVWALEAFTDEPNLGRYRLVHWRGNTARAFEYETRGGRLSAIAPISRTSAWIVGTGPLLTHWNGRSAVAHWTALDTLPSVSLRSISAVSSTEIWAAGDHLLARYSP
jgi:hypothetical protein